MFVAQARPSTIIADPVTASPVRGLPAVKYQRTSSQDKPVLDERTFQRLLTAAYMLQQHNDHLLSQELKADYAQTFLHATAAATAGSIPAIPLVSEIATHPEPPTEAVPRGPVHLALVANRYRNFRRRFSLTDEVFWKAATAVAVAAVSTLLLGAAVLRSSPLPAGLALPSQTRMAGRKALVADLPAASAAQAEAAAQPPARRVKRSPEADIIAEDTVIRYGRRSASPRLQAQKKP